MKDKQKKSVWRECGSKVRYRDAGEAGKAAKKCMRARGGELDFYWCTYCNGYHLTSKEMVKHEVHTRYNPKKGEIVKDKHCIGCSKILSCAGKPRGVQLCINYEVRKAE